MHRLSFGIMQMMHNLHVHCHIFRGVEQTLSIGFIAYAPLSQSVSYMHTIHPRFSHPICRQCVGFRVKTHICCHYSSVWDCIAVCDSASHHEYELKKNEPWLWCETMIIIRYLLFHRKYRSNYENLRCYFVFGLIMATIFNILYTFGIQMHTSGP